MANIPKMSPRIATTDDPAGKSKCIEKKSPKKLPKTPTSNEIITIAFRLREIRIADTGGIIR